MTQPTVAAYGSWKSPITADAIVASSIGLGQVKLDGEAVYWTELRPQEKGRTAIARCTPDGTITDALPGEFNARSRVHEYGSGAFTVADGTIYFSHDGDRRIYRQTLNEAPVAISPEGPHRYADFMVDRQRQRLICICETHHPNQKEPENSLVSLPFEGGSELQTLQAGCDFYASPCLSPDGSHLAWLSWNHPNLPWDGTELWVAAVDADGSLGEVTKVAGGVEESIFQPSWSPDGVLHFVSDRTGWWNLYRWQQGEVKALCPMEAEFGLPQWVFGMSTYGFETADHILCTYTQQGLWYLARLDATSGKLTPIDIPYTAISSLQVNASGAAFIGSSPTQSSTLVRLTLATNTCTELRRSNQIEVDSHYLSIPEPIEFPTENGQTAYGFFYPPTNRDHAAPEAELPPLLVKSHGGPTAATSSALSFKIQYWTSRGVAVLDVNYGGSTGYGRAYCQRLKDKWGIVDVDDCTNGARYLAEQGRVDGNRLAIAGSSAGGYTTLAALTFRDTFKAGASYYGISDLEALARDTHKFESRYLDGLIGPYPERKDLYEARSPLHFTERLSCPIIFFQGAEDKVVPPNQAEAMVNQLRQKGLPVAYVLFEGEQHGFRRSETIKRALEGELYFYSRVFGFELADPVEPVVIDNLA